MDERLVADVRAGLAARGDQARAADMQRYMKSAMPFRGVPAPQRRALGKRLFADRAQSTVDDWLATVLELWRSAEYREERYLALDLTGERRYARWQTTDLVPVYQEMIVTGAWWDFVDELASRRIGVLLRAHPTELTPVLLRWATDADRWLRRTAVICQLGSKDAVDTTLLTAAIEANVDDPDFFLRKGIGWALRQHARVDPTWVRNFVDTHPALSPLSRREAMKHL